MHAEDRGGPAGSPPEQAGAGAARDGGEGGDRALPAAAAAPQEPADRRHVSSLRSHVVVGMGGGLGKETERWTKGFPQKKKR